MMTYFEIKGLKVPVYGLMGLLGLIAGMIYLLIGFWKNKRLLLDLIYIYIWSAGFALFGAKLLFWIVGIPQIISIIQSSERPLNDVLMYFINGGLVFYGGLIGGIAGVALSCRFFSMYFTPIINCMIPVLPLVHTFGRIGCFIVGCCYGKQTDSIIHVIYTSSDFAPNGIPLIPTQLIEAICEFILFIVILVLMKEGIKHITCIYLISYAVVRFILEFFRGDQLRGIWLGLSTSQWISLVLIVVTVVYLMKNTKASSKQELKVGLQNDLTDSERY